MIRDGAAALARSFTARDDVAWVDGRMGT
jgi:hypothetical protein